MSANNYYSFDKCYSIPTNITEPSFNNNLTTNFYHYTVAKVKDCENKALRNNSEFFLINDVSRSSSLNNNIYINCYIPKVDNNNTSIFGNNTIFQKSLEFFNGLFNTNNTTNPYITQPMPIADICDNLMYNYIRYPNFNDTNRTCFKYSIDEQIYTPKNRYARYTKPTFSLVNITLMKNVKPPSDYTTGLSFESLRDYIDILKFNSNSDYGSLTDAYVDYICYNTPESNNALDDELNLLNQNYANLFTRLDEIKTDLSTINYLNSYDDETLRSINLHIVNKSRELNSLLTSGGANNGRLDDTSLLTYFKIIENSILLLLIICFVFYFTKKKAI